jgi:hypothetical protein
MEQSGGKHKSKNHPVGVFHLRLWQEVLPEKLLYNHFHIRYSENDGGEVG